MKRDVIIALDFSTREETLVFLDRFINRKPYVKVGMELFYAQGIDIIKEIKRRGHQVFLDLKLHDIPNTVKKSMMVLAGLDIDMINVHAAGTFIMMQAALEGLVAGCLYGRRPILIAVTQLTSTSQQQLREDLLIERPIEDVVAHYAQRTRQAGLDGIVCSPLESKGIHRLCGDEFLTITPGIRFAEKRGDDQTRITSPAQAKALGSNYIVVGRPITQATDPVAVYNRCIEEFV